MKSWHCEPRRDELERVRSLELNEQKKRTGERKLDDGRGAMS